MTIYHVGNLVKDRLKNKALDSVASELWYRAMRRELFLYQSRIREDVFAYHYVTRPPKK